MDFKLSQGLFLLLLPIAMSAQFRISGTVVDRETLAPVPLIKVFDNNSGQEVMTGTSGTFELSNLAAGVHRLIFFNEAYPWEEIEIELTENKTITITLKKTTNLSEVVIQAKQKEYFDLKRIKDVEGMSIYAGKKNEVVVVDQIVGNKSNSNARQVYAQVAGLNIYESINCGLQLAIGGRGLDPNRTSNFNTRQNNYDISADVLGYPESYYTPPVEALQEIQIVRGAASLQYGTQFGGLINFKLREPSNRSFELVTRQTYDTNCGYANFNSISGTNGKFSHYSFIAYKNNLNEAPRPNMELEAVNVFTNLNYQLSPKTKLGLEFTHLGYTAQQPGGLTDAQFYQDSYQSIRSRNWFRVNWNLLALKLDHQFSENSKMNLIAWGMDSSRDAIGFRTNRVSQVDDLENPEPRDLQKGDFRNWGAEFRYLTNYRIGKRKSTLLLGSKYYQAYNSEKQAPGSTGSDADFDFVEYELNELPIALRQSDFDFPNLNVAVFGENIFYLSEKLSVTPGFRIEYIKTESTGTYRALNRDLANNVLLDSTFADNRTRERTIALFGLGLSYKPKKALEFYGNISQNYRSVTFSDIRIVNPTFRVDPNISDERGFSADLGLRGQYQKVLSYDANIFGLLYDDRIDQVLRQETIINSQGIEEETRRLVSERGNIGKAFIYGLEGLADLNLKETFFPAETEYKLNAYLNLALTQSEFTESAIPGVEGNELPFVPNINLRTGLKMGYKNLLADLQFTYLSDQFTDASNATQDLNDNVSGIIGTTPAYSVWDLSFAYTYKNWKLETGINNLTDENYFTQRATGYPGPGIIPALPRSFYATIQLKL